MTPLEKKRYFDTIQKEFNAYKIAGSMLMQNNQIDAKTYYSKVRDKGVQLGIIKKDEYPTDLPSIVEPAFRITGATIGAIAGIAGGVPGQLLRMSIGSGVGGGTATAVYREFAELLSPDIPVAPIGTKIKEAGLAGGVDFAGMMAFGGAGNFIGNIINKSRNMSTKSMNNLNSLGDDAIKKTAEGIPRKTGFIKKFFISKSEDVGKQADIIANQMEKEGFTPYLGLVAPEWIRSYFGAAGAMPVIGSPQRGLFSEQMTNVANRMTESMKNQVRSGNNPMFSEKGFRWTGTEFERTKPVRPDSSFGSTLIDNVTKRIEKEYLEKNAAWQTYNNSINNLPGNIKISLDNPYAYMKGEATKETSLASMLGLKKGGISTMSQYYSKPFPNQGPAVNSFIDGILAKAGLSRGNNKINLTGQETNRLYSSIKDRVIEQRNKIVASKYTGTTSIPEETAKLNAALDLKTAFESNLKASGVLSKQGDDISALLTQANTNTGKLANTIEVNRDAIKHMSAERTILKNLYNDPHLGMKAEMRELTGLTLSDIGKISKNGVDDVLRKYKDSGDIKNQLRLKSLLGEQEYRALVQQEIDDIYWNNLLAPNKFQDFKKNLPALNEAMGITGNKKTLLKSRLTAMFQNNNVPKAQAIKKANERIAEMERLHKTFGYVLSHPDMSTFVLRNAILSKGNIGIGAVGVLGFMGGGILGTASSMGLMYAVSNFLSKPYSKQLLSKAAAGPSTASGREAINEISREMRKGSAQAHKFNRLKEVKLALSNPTAYKRYTELLRQSGIEITAQTAFDSPNYEPKGGPFDRREVFY